MGYELAEINMDIEWIQNAYPTTKEARDFIKHILKQGQTMSSDDIDAL